jgi:hypothetical protein
MSDIDRVVPSRFFEDFATTINSYFTEAFLYQKIEIKSSEDKHENIIHEPRHDVESMFWVLCIALARANPKRNARGSQRPSSEYNNFCERMLLEDDPTKLRDDRGSYLHVTEVGWREILHPDLADAASLLHHMGNYLAIRTYDAERKSWGSYHAHDMFRVLLFAAIEKFRKNPVPLCVHAPRYTRPLALTRTRTPTIGTSESFTFETSTHNSHDHEVPSHHSDDNETTAHHSGDQEATNHHSGDHEIMRHHTHDYNTRTKHSVESGRSISAKRAREIESSDESNNDRPDDADFVPVGRQVKKRKIEKGKQPAKPHKDLVPNFHMTHLDGLAIKEREGFMNREAWFFQGGDEDPSCGCAMLEEEDVAV